MNDKEALLILEQLNEYITKSVESKLKNVVRTKTATVVSVNNDATVTIKFPYEDENKQLTIPNKTSDDISSEDEVIIVYWCSLSNAFVMMRK